jgi:hypothetical protein
VALPVTNEIIRWARWFLADRGTRAASPRSTATVSEYLGLLIKDNTKTSLLQALAIQPENAMALARLAHLFLEPRYGEEPVTARNADFLSRLATEIAPGDPQIARIRAETTKRVTEQYGPQ